MRCTGYAAGSLADAFDVNRELAIVAGQLEMDAHQPVILLTHQILALLTVALVLASAAWILARHGITSWASPAPFTAIALFLLALWEGSQPSLLTANLHNALSLLLLLTLVLQIEKARHT